MAQDSKHSGSAPGLPQLFHGQQLPTFPILGCVRKAKRIPSPRSYKDQPVHGECLHGMGGKDGRLTKGSVGSGSPEAIKEQIAED